MTARHCNRRGFLSGVVPGCVATCLCLQGSQGQAQSARGATPSAPGHKFDRATATPLTYRQRFQEQYASHLIPYLKILDRAVGRSKVVETLTALSVQEAEDYAKIVVKQKRKNDISVFKEDYSPSTPGIRDILTIDVLEDTPTVWAIKITECLWATVFRDAGASQFGYAAVCAGDAPFARAVNPKIDLDLRGTLMEGKPACLLRYYVND